MEAEKITVKIVRDLVIPMSNSHKGQNGKVLVIAGSEKYHGSLMLILKTLSRLVDLVYVCSTPSNLDLVKQLKSELADFITIEKEEVEHYLPQIEVILVGPGLGVDAKTGLWLNNLLITFPEKKWVIDADALHMVDKKLLNSNCLLTPHLQEFEDLFEVKASPEALFNMAQEFGCLIVLKGQADYVSDGKTLRVNRTGNAGMTKGGTGDILAGLIAGFVAKNDLMTAGCAGVFVNGYAGDELFKQKAYYYNASDLAEEIPIVLSNLTKK